MSQSRRCFACGIRIGRGHIQKHGCIFKTQSGEVSVCAHCCRTLQQRGYLLPQDREAWYLEDGVLKLASSDRAFGRRLFRLRDRQQAVGYLKRVASGA